VLCFLAAQSSCATLQGATKCGRVCNA
jgi:hypothetical protein